MARDDLSELRIFLAVAEERGFAPAARRLGIGASAATRAVAALEARLGLQLFVRTTRTVALTAEGAVLAARAGPLVEDLDAALAEMADLASADRGRIRLNAPVSFGTLVLPPILAAFRRAHPGIALSVTLDDTLEDIVAEDRDLAIRISQAPADKSTIWRKICPVERLLVAAPDHPAAAAGSPEEIAPEACLAYSAEGGEEIWALSREGQRRSLRAGAGLSASNGDLLAGLARDGAGIARLPAFIVADDLAAGRLVRILPGWETEGLWLTLFYPPYDRLPPRIATFSDFFEAAARARVAGTADPA